MQVQWQTIEEGVEVIVVRLPAKRATSLRQRHNLRRIQQLTWMGCKCRTSEHERYPVLFGRLYQLLLFGPISLYRRSQASRRAEMGVHEYEQEHWTIYSLPHLHVVL